MKKSIIALSFGLALALVLPLGVTAFAAETLPAFSDDFESYETGKYIETVKPLTEKWDNNVFRGGEALGMDSHIYNVGKVEYENGTDGNKVLHLNNTTGADSFFYMGPAGDYRVKNFTVEFRLKFLMEGIGEHGSWAGISFRKKANSHYTGTNNLMFVVGRSKGATSVIGHGYAIMGGGSPQDLSDVGTQLLYGDKLSFTHTTYSVSGATEGADLPWIAYKLVADENTYKLYADEHLIADCTFDVNSFDYFGYLSLNCCTSNILVDDFNVTVQDETLPPEILPLATPVVTLDEANKRITWEEVEGAAFYLVRLGENNEKTVSATKYDLDRLRPGTYSITVTALSDDPFIAKDSAPSAPISYTVAGEDGAQGSGGETGGGCGSVVAFSGFGAVLLAAAALTVRRKRK